MAKNRAIAIPPESWTKGRLQAVTLFHPRPGCQVLTFPDASECLWGSFVTQVPDAEMQRCLPVEDMTHEPLALLGASFIAVALGHD